MSRRGFFARLLFVLSFLTNLFPRSRLQSSSDRSPAPRVSATSVAWASSSTTPSRFPGSLARWRPSAAPTSSLPSAAASSLYVKFFVFARVDDATMNTLTSCCVFLPRPTTNPSWRLPSSWTGCGWSLSPWCGYPSCTAWRPPRPLSTRPSATSARSVPSSASGRRLSGSFYHTEGDKTELISFPIKLKVNESSAPVRCSTEQ